MTDINPELIELHAEAICNATGGPQWDELQSTRQAGVMRAEARAALAVVAPLIAAKALRDAAGSSIPRGALALETRSWLRARADKTEGEQR